MEHGCLLEMTSPAGCLICILIDTVELEAVHKPYTSGICRSRDVISCKHPKYVQLMSVFYLHALKLLQNLTMEFNLK
jgi:hypothetical protein